MCGILGIVSFNNGVSSDELIAANSIIRHRGPDDEGFLTIKSGEDAQIWAGADTAVSTIKHWGYPRIAEGNSYKVGLGHRRLSILDLTPVGHQPMMYKQANLAITFNGEVYNYIEIRETLEALGHIFVTRTDTEVILHAWAEWGPQCLQRFNGMFAFIIADYAKNEMYAVRDRFGVKPLYYYRKNDKIVLASEIKQVRTIPGFKPEMNEDAVVDFLTQGLVDHSTRTFDANIQQVPPGHFVYINFGAAQQFRIEQWYQLNPVQWQGTWQEAVNKFQELLTDAVRLRLRADVAVGSCLSGGYRML
jgi:asparagine synthase (glutamine-hydrolysing)